MAIADKADERAPHGFLLPDYDRADLILNRLSDSPELLDIERFFPRRFPG